jgi:hypothetical protein
VEIAMTAKEKKKMIKKMFLDNKILWERCHIDGLNKCISTLETLHEQKIDEFCDNKVEMTCHLHPMFNTIFRNFIKKVSLKDYKIYSWILLNKNGYDSVVTFIDGSEVYIEHKNTTCKAKVTGSNHSSKVPFLLINYYEIENSKCARLVSFFTDLEECKGVNWTKIRTKTSSWSILSFTNENFDNLCVFVGNIRKSRKYIHFDKDKKSYVSINVKKTKKRGRPLGSKNKSKVLGA